MHYGLHEILSSSIFFNLQNNNQISKSAQIILVWFLKDHVTLKTGVKAAENSAFTSQEKTALKKNIFK